MKPLFYSLVSFMVSCFLCKKKQSRSSTETDEADEAFNVTENKTNLGLFFLKYYL